LLDSLLQENYVSTMASVKTRFDSIVKSQQDKREYRGLELVNGMKVLLISDPTTDKAAAAMDVHIGHMSDPRELPGLAHFCEHMLFLGTERYPDENEYSKYLSVNGGSHNAFTSPDHTNYFFDISPDKLEGALDRFSQFFTAPLFTESATDREVKAVHSEHEKNIPNDTWRGHQVEKATSNPDHDFSKFGTGNEMTLDTLPKEKGMVVRDELLRFHKKWYSSNIMGLTILGQQDLDSLEEMVVDMMAGVMDKQVTVPEWPEAPFGDNELKTITHIVPVKDIRTLGLTWGVPDLNDEYKSRPTNYLSHLIGHEGPGSLLSELKARGWVNNLVAGQSSGAKGFGFFVAKVDLTEEGIKHTDDIIKLIFQYLEMLRDAGPKAWIFEEYRDLSAIQFRFKDKERPQGYVCSLAGYLHDYPIEEVLSGGYLVSEWKPERITEILNQLTPARVRVTITAQRFQDSCDQEEKFYGAKYKTEKIDEHKLADWSSCGLHPNLNLPERNEFIPTNFELAARDDSIAPHPTIIEEDELGRLWYKQDDEFLLPKTCISLVLRSPLAYSSPHHANLTYMFAMLFKDELNEFVYAAELAGLGYSLANTTSGISLSIKGYNDKQRVLLEKIMDKLTAFQVNEKRFEILKENYARGLKNFRGDQPHQHAMYFNSVVLQEKIWTKAELTSVLDTLSVEELKVFIPRMLANVKLECLVYGNIGVEGARDMYKHISNRLKTDCKSRPLLPSQMIRERREVQLTSPNSMYKTTNEVHKASCIEVYYQCGLQSTRSNMLLELLADIVKEPCFDQLRTKEQLGYIVHSGVRRSSCVQGLRIIVQSDKHPEYLETRVELYINNLAVYIKNMSDEEFSAHKEGLATKRLEKPKKLSVKNGRFWSEIASEHLHFDRDNVEVEFLRTIKKSEILEFYETHVAHAGSDRHKLSCHVLSMAPGGSGTADSPEKSAGDTESVETGSVELIEDIVEFKSFNPLFPLIKPYASISAFKR